MTESNKICRLSEFSQKHNERFIYFVIGISHSKCGKSVRTTDAEDIIQNAYLKVWKFNSFCFLSTISSVEHAEKVFLFFMFRALVFCTLDWLRSSKPDFLQIKDYHIVNSVGLTSGALDYVISRIQSYFTTEYFSIDELNVLPFLMDGSKLKDIADYFGFTISTVFRIKKTIYSKLSRLIQLNQVLVE